MSHLHREAGLIFKKPQSHVIISQLAQLNLLSAMCRCVGRLGVEKYPEFHFWLSAQQADNNVECEELSR